MSDSRELRLSGKAAAPGRARGPVHLVTDATLLDPFPPGAIVVTRIVHPHQAPLMARVAGIVTEEGSLLQHATTLAREFRIPAVVGVRDVTSRVRNGDAISIDGSLGVVELG